MHPKSDVQCQGARNPITAPTSLSKQHNMPNSWGNKVVSIAGIDSIIGQCHGYSGRRIKAIRDFGAPQTHSLWTTE